MVAISPSFRRLSAADAETVAQLEKECFTLPWTLDQCRAALTQKTFGAFGLFDGATLVGYISVYHVAQEMEIVNLAVAAPWRRQGLGRRILRLLLQVAHKMGMQSVSLEVRQGNAAAISLYQSVGFRRVGRRKAYYPDTGEDGLIMFLELKDNSHQ